jgi:hypothetical protein
MERMDIDWPHRLPELLRYVVSACSILSALLPVWGKSEASKRDRWIVVCVTAVVTVLVWPSDVSYCKYRNVYGWSAVVLIIYTLVAHLIEGWLKRRFGHSQGFRDGNQMKTRTILGGPALTPAAYRLHTEEGLTTQQILDEFDSDPLQVWEKVPYVTILFADWFFRITKALALMFSIIAALALLMLRFEMDRFHVPLTIDKPSNDQLVQVPGKRIAFEWTSRECDPTITWTIDAPSDSDQSSAGEVSKTGIYTAPHRIDRDLDVFVIATPEHVRESKRVKIQLRPHPDSSVLQQSEGVDEKGNSAEFFVEILNQAHSWTFGDTTIADGTDGASLAAQMAASGILDGYEDIICVGSASHEYATETEEECRAATRADLLAHWILAAVKPKHARIHALTIGRYDDNKHLTPSETANERRVVIVGVQGAGRTLDIISALRDAFRRKRSKEPLLGIFLDKYPMRNWRLWRVPNDSGRMPECQ